MWVDTSLEMSDGDNFTASGDSTDHINLGSDRDVGPGHPLYWIVQVDTADLDDGDANETYVVNLETDSTSDFATTPTVIASFTFTRGDVVGTKQWVSVPSTNLQFLQTQYVLGGTTPDGTFSSFITHEQPESWVSYPDAVN